MNKAELVAFLKQARETVTDQVDRSLFQRGVIK